MSSVFGKKVYIFGDFLGVKQKKQLLKVANNNRFEFSK